MASTARSHVEGVVMVFYSTWWLLRVCREIECNHGGILAVFLGNSIECLKGFCTSRTRTVCCLCCCYILAIIASLCVLDLISS